MTEAHTLNRASDPYAASEDLTMPIVVYVLYLLALPTAFLSMLLGLILAYANRDAAGPAARSHYEFAIRTFWLSIVGVVVGIVACAVGGVTLIFLIGIPILIVGVLMLVLGKLWYIVRCILGIMYAARREAYPRPEAVMA